MLYELARLERRFWFSLAAASWSLVMIRGLHHPALVTADIERAKQFYCDVFEFEALFDYEWGSDDETFNSVIGMGGTVAKKCLLKGKNSYLELFEYLSPDSEADPQSLNASDRAISSRSADSAWRRSAA